MGLFRRDDSIKTFEEIESPRKSLSYEEVTGRKADGKPRYQMKPVGGGYVELVLAQKEAA